MTSNGLSPRDRRVIAELVDQVNGLDNQLDRLARAQQARLTTIHAGDGSGIQVVDEHGNVVSRFGGAGSLSGDPIEYVGGPVPDAPAVPEVEPEGQGALRVALMDEPPADLAQCRVYASIDPAEVGSLAGSIWPGEDGASIGLSAGVWHVRLQWVTKSGKQSEFSGSASAEVEALVDVEEMQTHLDEFRDRLESAREDFEAGNQERIDELEHLNEVVLPALEQSLTDAMTELEERVGDVDLGHLESALAELNETRLPALEEALSKKAESSELPALEGRLTSAFGEGLDAAVAAASEDATAKADAAQAAAEEKAGELAKAEASAAQSAAEAAAAQDALEKANAARDAAIESASGDAQEKADAAKEAAEAAAAADAKAKADAAQAEAIRQAALDATAKADAAKTAAENAAKEYADQQDVIIKGEAAADAQTKADAAQAEAERLAADHAELVATGAKDDAIAEAGRLHALAIAEAEAAQARADEAHTDAGNAWAHADAAMGRANAVKGEAAADAQAKADAVRAEAQEALEFYASRGDNLIFNGSFERSGEGWRTQRGEIVQTVEARTGGHALLLGQENANDYPMSDWIATEPGRAYLIEYWAKKLPGGTTPRELRAYSQYRLADGSTPGGYARNDQGNIALAQVADLPENEWVKVSGTLEIIRPTTNGVSFGPHILATGTKFYIDDFRVVDITEAKAALEAAELAQEAADDARQHADALPKVLHGTGAPSGTAPNGSIWWQHQGSLQGAVTAQWNRVGGSWVSTPIDSEAIANLDVGKLTAGGAVISDAVIQDLTASNGAFDRLDAREGWVGGVALEDGAVTARTVDVESVFTNEAVVNTLWADRIQARVAELARAVIAAPNLWPDPDFEQDVYGSWSLVEGGIERDGAESLSVSYVSDDNYHIPIEYGVPYRISVDLTLDGPGRGELWVRDSDENKAYIGSTARSANLQESGTLVYEYQPSSNSNGLARHFYIGFGTRGTPETTRLRFDNFRVERMTDGSLIVEDTINTRHLVAEAVKAANIDVEELFANEAVVNTVWAEVVRAGLLTAEEALIGGALIKDDAITTPKLNVTEEMVARLASFVEVWADKFWANEAFIDRMAASEAYFGSEDADQQTLVDGTGITLSRKIDGEFIPAAQFGGGDLQLSFFDDDGEATGAITRDGHVSGDVANFQQFQWQGRPVFGTAIPEGNAPVFDSVSQSFIARNERIMAGGTDGTNQSEYGFLPLSFEAQAGMSYEIIVPSLRMWNIGEGAIIHLEIHYTTDGRPAVLSDPVLGNGAIATTSNVGTQKIFQHMSRFFHCEDGCEVNLLLCVRTDTGAEVARWWHSPNTGASTAEMWVRPVGVTPAITGGTRDVYLGHPDLGGGKKSYFTGWTPTWHQAYFRDDRSRYTGGSNRLLSGLDRRTGRYYATHFGGYRNSPAYSGNDDSGRTMAQALSGAFITDGTLTLTGAPGPTSAGTVWVRWHRFTSKPTTLNLDNVLSIQSVRVSAGQQTVIDLPRSVLDAIAAGTFQGFTLYHATDRSPYIFLHSPESTTYRTRQPMMRLRYVK